MLQLLRAVRFAMAAFAGGLATLLSHGQVTPAPELPPFRLRITQPPQDVVAAVGGTATFSISVTGSSPTYEWRKDGALIPEATQAAHTITNVRQSDEGIYSVRVSNPRPSGVSGSARLTVIAPTENTLKLRPDGVHGGFLRLLLSSTNDANYELQSSSDLKTWSTMLRTNGPGTLLQFAVPATNRFQFYRAATYSPGIELLGVSTNRALPGSIITPLAAGLDPAASLKAQFFTRAGLAMEAPLVPASNGVVRATVPPHFDFARGEYGAGPVSLRLVQRSGIEQKESAFLHDFTILDLPVSLAPPGTVTKAFLEGSLRAALKTMNDLAFLELAAGAGADSSPVRNALSAIAQRTAAVIQSVDLILTNPATSIELGRLGSEPIIINAASLQVSDRLLSAYVQSFQSILASANAGVLVAQATGDRCGTAPPPPLELQPITEAARNISEWRGRAEVVREWAASGAGYAEALNSALGWVPPKVPAQLEPIVSKAKHISQTAHVATLLGATVITLGIDAWASYRETGQLQAADLDRAAQFIEETQLYESSADILIGTASDILGAKYLPSAGQEALGFLGYFGMEDPLKALMGGLPSKEEPARFWANNTELVRAAGPIPATTVSGCVLGLRRDGWLNSSVRLVLPPGIPPLYGLVQPDGYYQARVPTAEIGLRIPADAVIVLISEGAFQQQLPLNLGLGSQEVDFPAPPVKCADCFPQYEAASAACDALPNLIDQLRCVNAAIAAWQKCEESCVP